MPWLIKGNDDPSQNLFFVHVPRCGGTSLTSHYDVPKKAMEGRSLWGRIGLRIFFHRYEVLESANFPWKTKGTGGGLVALLVGLYLAIAHNEDAQRVLVKRTEVHAQPGQVAFDIPAFGLTVLPIDADSSRMTHIDSVAAEDANAG